MYRCLLQGYSLVLYVPFCQICITQYTSDGEALPVMMQVNCAAQPDEAARTHALVFLRDVDFVRMNMLEMASWDSKVQVCHEEVVSLCGFFGQHKITCDRVNLFTVDILENI